MTDCGVVGTGHAVRGAEDVVRVMARPCGSRMSSRSVRVVNRREYAQLSSFGGEEDQE